ncbi:hypothetical protein LXL04_029011 [Taraxacum kok-saghyz]
MHQPQHREFDHHCCRFHSTCYHRCGEWSEFERDGDPQKRRSSPSDCQHNSFMEDSVPPIYSERKSSYMGSASGCCRCLWFSSSSSDYSLLLFWYGIETTEKNEETEMRGMVLLWRNFRFFDHESLLLATNHFSDENRIG